MTDNQIWQGIGVPSSARTIPGEDADVVLLCALDLERDALLAALGPTGIHQRLASTVHSTVVGGHRVVVPPATGMGNVASAAAAQQAIDVWNPRFLLLVGIAAGISGKVALGDLLIPDKIVGYEAGKLTPAGLDPDPDPYRPDYRLLAAAKAVESAEWAAGIVVARPDASARTPVPWVGTVHTGEKVVADDHTADDLRTGWRRTIGFEMESLGVALAAYRNGPGFLMIKGVCDHADPAKGDDWQPYAADAAARFGVAVLRRAPAVAGARRQAVRPMPALFTGRTKIAFADRLGPDWSRLADYFDIPMYDRDAFPLGRQPQGVWEWLDRRTKLYALPDALAEIGRSDLAALLEPRRG
jgi:nucleoside phosphorylase